MARTKPKKHRVPRTRAGGTLTESAFFGFIRSGLRQKSTRWKPSRDCMTTASRPITKEDQKKRGIKYRSEYQCAHCEEWFRPPQVIKGKKKTHIAADHIVPVGSLKTFDDLAGFAERLFVEEEGFQALCTECHAVKTKEDKR